ncbi:hypothetical protein [Kitasatospora sp. NPDC059817]|uniref:hypothetical protein n=1 Tax=Kitasatospora sp. NPDC059817 TaxID=3346961 RepID=UPI00364E2522
MSATCPQCTAPDQSVLMAHALADTTAPLDDSTRALLYPPPEPQPAPAEPSTGAIVLFVLAAVFGLLGVLSQLRDDEDLSGYDSAYQLGYHVGPFILPAVLLVIGLIVWTVSRSRHRRAVERGLPEQRALWQRHLHVWQAGWLCRRCQVAFFPDASIRPDFPASPAIPVEQFPLWVMTAAERAFAGQGQA